MDNGAMVAGRDVGPCGGEAKCTRGSRANSAPSIAMAPWTTSAPIQASKSPTAARPHGCAGRTLRRSPRPRHASPFLPAMPTRIAHRLRLFTDRDVLHTGLVTFAACAFSAGLVYVGYFLHVLRVARRAPCVPEHGDCVLLFGKHAPRGKIDADFAARLD